MLPKNVPHNKQLDEMNEKTPISALQELMQANRLQPPRYFEEDYGNKFKCTVFAGGVSAIGVSTTKKAAKHESAKNALQLLKFSNPTQVTFREEVSLVQKSMDNNYIGLLNEYSSKKSVAYPSYDLLPNSGLLGNSYFMKCSFLNKQTIGRGLNKKDAKQDSARIMLQLIEKEDKKYTIVQSKTVVKTEDLDEIIALYRQLSVCKPPKEHVEDLGATSHIDVLEYQDKEDNVEVLKAKLVDLGVQYTLSDLQTEPNAIVSLVIKGTNFNFLESGKTREEAVKKILQNVLMVKKSGLSFNTDLITF